LAITRVNRSRVVSPQDCRLRSAISRYWFTFCFTSCAANSGYAAAGEPHGPISGSSQNSLPANVQSWSSTEFGRSGLCGSMAKAALLEPVNVHER